MKLLADEGIDRQIVAALREDGHEVLYIAELDPGIGDGFVLEQRAHPPGPLISPAPAPELQSPLARFQKAERVSRGDDTMKCQTPGCDAEHEPRAISHSVVYRQRTVVIHQVPAEVCPDCGSAVLTEETTVYLEGLLRRKARSKAMEFVFEA